MAKYLFVYHGGSGMPETEEAQAELMKAWGAWFGVLGDSVVDGGNPIGPSKTVASSGSVSSGGGAGAATGYSLVSASSLDEAVEKAKGCPVIAGGGSVQVCETIDM